MRHLLYESLYENLMNLLLDSILQPWPYTRVATSASQEVRGTLYELEQLCFFHISISSSLQTICPCTMQVHHSCSLGRAQQRHERYFKSSGSKNSQFYLFTVCQKVIA